MDANPPPALGALKAAVVKIGSQSAAGRLLGVSQAAVWGWLNVKLMLPAEHVLTVEAKTGISRHLLRPDVYGPEPIDAAPPAPAARSLDVSA